MSNTHCRFCEETFKGLYLNCPKCGKWLAPVPGKDIEPEPYQLAESPKPSDNWSNSIIRAVQECRSENQDQRFGQLLYNLIYEYKKSLGHEPNDEDFHNVLYNLEDYELAAILKKYAEKGFETFNI